MEFFRACALSESGPRPDDVKINGRDVAVSVYKSRMRTAWRDIYVITSFIYIQVLLRNLFGLF